jgi:signal transduction histidine kinase
MLGVVAAAAWAPGPREVFALRPAAPLALLALLCAFGFGANAFDARRRFSPVVLLVSTGVHGAILQLFAWSLMLCSHPPGDLVFANGPIMVAASHSLRVRPTLRFPWPLAGHAVGIAAACAVAPPERATVALVVAPLALATGLLLGAYAERLRRAEGLLAEHIDAIRAHELGARAAELSGLSGSLLELMQRGHDARSALSGALLDAEEIERIASREAAHSREGFRAAAARLGQTLARLRERVDARRGLLSAAPGAEAAAPAVPVMPAVLFAVAAARLRTSTARIAARAAPGAKRARARVAGGEESLGRMLEILVDNAWQGDGVRAASQVDVEVSVEARTGALAIAVLDDGPGFPPDLLDRPLSPFVSRKPGGLGLGLYTAERLARASGGSLRRANRPEGGAVVTLYLELAPSEPAPAGDAA